MRNGWIRFMCPIWPIVGLSADSPVSTRLPPWRPASQVRPSLSRLSSKSLLTLTCRRPASFMGFPDRRLRGNDSGSSTRLPLREHARERVGVDGARQPFAERALREHLRELGQELQVLVGRLL